MKVSLVSRFPLGRQGEGVAAEFVLNPGETTTFILRQVEENGHDSVHDGVLLEARPAQPKHPNNVGPVQWLCAATLLRALVRPS